MLGYYTNPQLTLPEMTCGFVLQEISVGDADGFWKLPTARMLFKTSGSRVRVAHNYWKYKTMRFIRTGDGHWWRWKNARPLYGQLGIRSRLTNEKAGSSNPPGNFQSCAHRSHQKNRPLQRTFWEMGKSEKFELTPDVWALCELPPLNHEVKRKGR